MSANSMHVQVGAINVEIDPIESESLNEYKKGLTDKGREWRMCGTQLENDRQDICS